VGVLLWLCVIEPPTVLYCPLKLMPPVFCTVMVIESAVIAAVLLSRTPSSSYHGLLALMTGVSVTLPLPTPAGFTVRRSVAVCESVPLLPVTVGLAVPVVAVLDAAKVSVLLAVVETGLKLAVTPAGTPLTLSVTLPVKPPRGVTLMVLLAVPPCVTVALVADKEKSGV